MVAVSRRKVLAGLAALGATGVAGAAAWRGVDEPAVVAEPSPTPVTPPSTSATPVTPSVAESPTARAMLAVPLLCRDAWDAGPARPTEASHVPARLTLHHTAVALHDNRKAPGRLRQHQRYHQDSGFSDIAYHVGVDRNGNLYELRDPAVPGETFTDYDPTGHYLLLAEGEFGSEMPSDAQLEGLALVMAAVSHDRGIAVETLTGHRDHDPATQCPGDNLYARLGDLRARADQILAEAEPELRIWCDDGAFQQVAAIERGET